MDGLARATHVSVELKRQCHMSRGLPVQAARDWHATINLNRQQHFEFGKLECAHICGHMHGHTIRSHCCTNRCRPLQRSTGVVIRQSAP